MFKNRIRLPFYLSRPQFPTERNVFRNAAGETKLLTAIIRNTYEGKTDQLPEDWHRKLVIALSHQEVTIEDNRLLTDVVIDGNYGIEWQEFLNYPIAEANFTIQVTPFNASSNNCQSCSEITQLELVDDTTDDVFEEGVDYKYPENVLANDNICCYPFTVEIVSFNTLYFDSVIISQDGLVEFTVKDSVPIIDNVLICTYRVTCENGGYDEANVYGNITGTNTDCLPPTGLTGEVSSKTPVTITYTWTPPAVTPAGGYDWEIYLSSDLGTPIYSGNTSANTIDITGIYIVIGLSYTFVITSNCGGSSSIPATYEFTVRRLPVCGKFMFYYVPVEEESIESITFIKCDGSTQTYIFTYSHAVEFCLLLGVDEAPYFVAASSPEISVTFIELC